MKPKVTYQEVLERMSQQWGPLETIVRDYSQVEVDMVVLFKELTRLVDFCGRIADSMPNLSLPLQPEER